MSITVAVIGAHGRMGATVCDAVEKASDMDLVAKLDRGDSLDAHTLAGAQVAVEFTVPSQSEANVHALLDAGVHVVVGTSGWTSESLQRVQEHAEKCGRGVLVTSNFSLSAVLLMDFCVRAARFFESAEVIEMHHPTKIDAPSGTATTTAHRIAQARQDAQMGNIPDATASDPDGARGAVVDGVHVHAVRLRGLNAHEEVLFGNEGEQLIIRQDSFDRTSFMPGVLLGIRKISQFPGLTNGLEHFLDLD